MSQVTTFSNLVAAATSPNSDIEKAVIGLLIFAEKNATEEDKANFIEWLDEKMFDAISTALTQSGDHFECAEGKTWAEMEAYV